MFEHGVADLGAHVVAVRQAEPSVEAVVGREELGLVTAMPLPMISVAYPASFSTEAMVCSSGLIRTASRERACSPPKSSKPMRLGYEPVSIEPRDGVHRAAM